MCNVSDDVYRKRVEDISLTEEQEANLRGLMFKLNELNKDDVFSKIEKGIENQTINSTNYDATVRKLESITEEKE